MQRFYKFPNFLLFSVCSPSVSILKTLFFRYKFKGRGELQGQPKAVIYFNAGYLS